MYTYMYTEYTLSNTFVSVLFEYSCSYIVDLVVLDSSRILVQLYSSAALQLYRYEAELLLGTFLLQ